MKECHLRARLPGDEYLALKKAADEEGLTISEYVRNVFLRDRLALSQEMFLAKIDIMLASISQPPATVNTDSNADLEPLIVESLFLVRELIAERNPQILGRIAQQLNNLYPERKKL